MCVCVRERERVHVCMCACACACACACLCACECYTTKIVITITRHSLLVAGLPTWEVGLVGVATWVALGAVFRLVSGAIVGNREEALQVCMCVCVCVCLCARARVCVCLCACARVCIRSDGREQVGGIAGVVCVCVYGERP